MMVNSVGVGAKRGAESPLARGSGGRVDLLGTRECVRKKNGRRETTALIERRPIDSALTDTDRPQPGRSRRHRSRPSPTAATRVQLYRYGGRRVASSWSGTATTTTTAATTTTTTTTTVSFLINRSIFRFR